MQVLSIHMQIQINEKCDKYKIYFIDNLLFNMNFKFSD